MLLFIPIAHTLQLLELHDGILALFMSTGVVFKSLILLSIYYIQRFHFQPLCASLACKFRLGDQYSLI